MNYVPVVAGNQTNSIAGTRDNIVTSQAEKKIEPEQEYILIPFCTTDPLISQGPKDSEEDSGMNPTGLERDRVVANLSQAEKDRLRADIHAMNILHVIGRFSKLINDMRHIKMTVPKIQLNSKFVNNMLPEWGRFVTAVKLNRGLKESNHDQLYAYLKQHELHANENKMLMERLNQHSHDPLALVSNVLSYQYPSSSSVPSQPSYTPPVTYQPQFTDNTQLDTGFSPAGELLDNLTKQVALLAQQYKTQFPQTNNQLRTSSDIQNQPIVQNGRVVVMGELSTELPKRPQNSDYFKEKMLLMQAQENGVDLDEEQLLFLAARQTNTFDDEVDKGPVQDMAHVTPHQGGTTRCNIFINITQDDR
ncbi:hypothetical protein Tco_0093614 [Tanacetum coccineum]